MTGAERSWASHYEINDVVRYTRGSKAIGIEAAAYASVVAINPAANQLTVEKPNQELATYDPRRLTGVSVYRKMERDLSVGDRIQFTAPDKSLSVANRDLATIETDAPTITSVDELEWTGPLADCAVALDAIDAGNYVARIDRLRRRRAR